jgi:hypothetical protein
MMSGGIETEEIPRDETKGASTTVMSEKMHGERRTKETGNGTIVGQIVLGIPQRNSKVSGWRRKSVIMTRKRQVSY